MARVRGLISLGALEKRLDALNAERDRIIATIRSAVDVLATPSSRAAKAVRAAVRGSSARPRRFSAATRRRLSQLAKARWAKAKKAGLTRLG